MSEKREKRCRYNLRLDFIAQFYKWLDSEPPRWKLVSWRRWRDSRPTMRREVETDVWLDY